MKIIVSYLVLEEKEKENNKNNLHIQREKKENERREDIRHWKFKRKNVKMSMKNELLRVLTTKTKKASKGMGFFFCSFFFYFFFYVSNKP